MAPGKHLLRHIFRHGAHSKVKHETIRAEANEPERPFAVAKPAETAPQSLPPRATPPKTPEPHTVDVLPKIAEETRSDTAADTDEDTDTASVITVLAALDLDVSTFTTRSLLHATMDEATAATDAHLGSVETILALLDALNGFSATISVLREEMLEKKRVCEEKLAMLERMEVAVEKMQFSDDRKTLG
jgi:hypothetical protein